MRVIFRVTVLLALGSVVGACVVEPGPRYGRGYWVPGHCNAWGRCVPGHWR